MSLTMANLGAEADLWIPIAGMPLLRRRRQAGSALTEGRPLRRAKGTVHGGHGGKVGLVSRGGGGCTGSRRLCRCSMGAIRSSNGSSLIASIRG